MVFADYMVENRVADHAKESNVQFAVHFAGLTLEEGGMGQQDPQTPIECTQISVKSPFIDSTEKIQDENKVGKKLYLTQKFNC